MELSKFIKTNKRNFKVFSHFLENNNLTIQISHILTTNIKKYTITTDEPAPQLLFNQPVKVLYFAVGLALLVPIFAFSPSFSFSFISPLVFVGILYFYYIKEETKWHLYAPIFEEIKDVWQDLQYNPPAFWELVITTPFEKQVFTIYSENEAMIKEINSAIKARMGGLLASSAPIEFSINCLDINPDAIKNLGASIYRSFYMKRVLEIPFTINKF